MKDSAVPGLSARAVLQKNKSTIRDETRSRICYAAAGRRLPSYSMDVGFYARGEIKVDDVGDVLEVHASGDAVFFVFVPVEK